MGKALLLVTFAAVLGGSILMVQQQGTEARTEQDLSGAESVFLAREAARSGYSVGTSEVALYFAPQAPRTNVATTNSDAGVYDLTVEQTEGATISVTSTGRIMRGMIGGRTEATEHTLWGEFVRIVENESAVLIDAEEIAPTFATDDFGISGNDRRPTTATGGVSQEGVGDVSYAVRTTRAGASADFWNVVTDAQEGLFEGKGAGSETGSIHDGEYDELLQSMYDETRARIAEGGDDIVTIGSDRAIHGPETFGSSPTNPKIVHMTGDTFIQGRVHGSGILVVDGNLTILGSSSNAEDNFAWEGLVFVRKDGEVSFTQSGPTRIEGGLVVQAPPQEVVDETIDFDIEDDGAVTVNERFAARAEILGAAISYDGRYDIPVTLGLWIGNDYFSPWGDEPLPVSSNINDGQNPRVFEFPNQYEAGERITVQANSFTRINGYDGSHDREWNTHQSVRTGTSSQLAKVLRNGDPVPQTEGFLSQASIADFVGDYVQDGQISLQDNQAIYLFELGQAYASPATDYQDVVVLVTLSREEETEEVATSARPPSFDCECSKAKKEAIIHLPGGDVFKANQLCVGSPAINAHRAHGDLDCTDYMAELDRTYGDGADDESGDGAGEETAPETISLVHFAMDNRAQVQYSSEAIGRVATLLSSAREVSEVKSIKQRSFMPDVAWESMPTPQLEAELGEEELGEGAINESAIVTACYNGEAVEMTMAEFDVLDGVATLGRCAASDSEDQEWVCHQEGQYRASLQVPSDALLHHVEHGDTLGQCDSEGDPGAANGGGGLLGDVLAGVGDILDGNGSDDGND